MKGIICNKTFSLVANNGKKITIKFIKGKIYRVLNSGTTFVCIKYENEQLSMTFKLLTKFFTQYHPHKRGSKYYE